MRDIRRRLDRIEKRLNIAGMETTSDVLIKVLEEIDGSSRGLPSKEEEREAKEWDELQINAESNILRIGPNIQIEG